MTDQGLPWLQLLAVLGIFAVLFGLPAIVIAWDIRHNRPETPEEDEPPIE